MVKDIFKNFVVSNNQTCETCGALRQTISILQEEVEHLRELLAVLTMSSQIIQPSETKSSPPVRVSREPWSRRQAKLERRSQQDARELIKEREKRESNA